MNIIKQIKDDNGNNIYPIGYAQGGMKMDLLWTNPSPTSDFASQTVSLDLSEYDHLYVSYLALSSGTVYCDFILKQKNVTIEQLSGVNQALKFRTALWNDSGITFSDCNSRTTLNGAGSTANGSLVPYRVYGIKLSYIVPTSVHGLQYVEV